MNRSARDLSGRREPSTVFVLHFAKFRVAAEKIGRWLRSARCRALFLDLPQDVSPFLRAYRDGTLSQERLWQSYRLLTGVKAPFINALRYTLEPVLDQLPLLNRRLPDLAVYGYQDLDGHLQAARLAERLLLLETRERVRRAICIPEWRTLLSAERTFAAERLERVVASIAETAGRHAGSAVLYGGCISRFKHRLEAEGFSVHPVYLHRYWRSPLGALRTLLGIHGINSTPDRVIRHGVAGHLRYLDYVLTSADADVAHHAWVSATLPMGSRSG